MRVAQQITEPLGREDLRTVGLRKPLSRGFLRYRLSLLANQESCQCRESSVFRTICAVTAATMIVCICTLASEPSRTVEAGTRLTMMADRLDIGQAGSDCALHGWPYYERECLRDSRYPAGQAPAVRLVSTDRSSPSTSRESSMHAATGSKTSLPKRSTTTYPMQSIVPIAPKPRAVEAQRKSPKITRSSAQPANQPSSRDEAERKSFTKAKAKSDQKATTGERAYRDSGYSSFAQEPPKWRSSAEGTLGPH